MKFLKWISLVIFIVAFLSTQGVIDQIPQIMGYEEYLMIIASVLAFLRATSGKWLGAILVGIGIAIWQTWIPDSFGNVSFRHEWIMLGGYASIFFSAR